MRSARAIVTGSIGGFASGLTGIGGGTVMVPMLTALMRLPQHHAHATSLVVVIFAATAAAIPYLVRDEVDWWLALGLGVGGVGGAQIGVRLMQHVAERQLRVLFALFLLVVGLRLVILG